MENAKLWVKKGGIYPKDAVWAQKNVRGHEVILQYSSVEKPYIWKDVYPEFEQDYEQVECSTDVIREADKQKKCLSEAQIEELVKESTTLRKISLLCLDYLEKDECLVAGIARILATLRRYQEQAAWETYEDVLENWGKAK